jgi:hypothetical protein
MPDTAMPWMKKCCAMKNTRITGRIVSVEPAMTRFQRVCPMKACWNRAKPGAAVYLVESRDRYSRGPMKSFQLLMRVNTPTVAKAGLTGGMMMCQSMPNSWGPLMGALSSSGFLLSE